MTLEGFKKVSAPRVKSRLIVSLSGLEKCGKSAFALTFPGPIAYFDFDRRADGVLSKVYQEKEIYITEFGSPFGDSVSDLKKTATKIWDDFTKKWNAALKSKEIRTVVIDTGTDLWEIVRLSHFGKLTEVMPHQYAVANGDFRELFKGVYESDKNVCFVHKLKEGFKGNAPSGKLEMAGQKDIPYIVEITLTGLYDPKTNDFGVKVERNGHNMSLNGSEMWDSNGQWGFLPLAMLSMPDAPMEAWI